MAANDDEDSVHDLTMGYPKENECCLGQHILLNADTAVMHKLLAADLQV